MKFIFNEVSNMSLLVDAERVVNDLEKRENPLVNIYCEAKFIGGKYIW